MILDITQTLDWAVPSGKRCSLDICSSGFYFGKSHPKLLGILILLVKTLYCCYMYILEEQIHVLGVCSEQPALTSLYDLQLELYYSQLFIRIVCWTYEIWHGTREFVHPKVLKLSLSEVCLW